MTGSASAPVLEVTGLGKRFGGVQAVADVSFSIAGERIIGIIGPNGSGKSTLFNLISRVIPATTGRVAVDGVDISSMRSDQVFKHGLSRTFQNTRLFPRLTLTENMLIAARGRRVDRSEAEAQLEQVELSDRCDAPAGSLSYGDRKLLELSMSLICDPAIVLLDEPLAGVHQEVVERIHRVVREAASRTVFVVVEHNVAFMMRICERILVMNQGRLLADGTPAEVRSDKAVISAYLGSDLAATAQSADGQP
ncbi:ABC transporter ATP-binding protein [Pseudonocardia sichuanensis]